MARNRRRPPRGRRDPDLRNGAPLSLRPLPGDESDVNDPETTRSPTLHRRLIDRTRQTRVYRAVSAAMHIAGRSAARTLYRSFDRLLGQAVQVWIEHLHRIPGTVPIEPGGERSYHSALRWAAIKLRFERQYAWQQARLTHQIVAVTTWSTGTILYIGRLYIPATMILLSGILVSLIFLWADDRGNQHDRALGDLFDQDEDQTEALGLAAIGGPEHLPAQLLGTYRNRQPYGYTQMLERLLVDSEERAMFDQLLGEYAGTGLELTETVKNLSI